MRCVFVFDDLLQILANGDQAAIAARIAGLKAKDHHGMAGAGIEHGLQGFGADKWRIAVKHNRFAAGICQQGSCLGDGMSGAQLRILQD